MGWMICAALCAYFIKGLCGFANTLVFTTILSCGYDNVNISPVELILGYPTNLMLIRKERASLKTKIWLPLTAIVLVGDIPGTVRQAVVLVPVMLVGMFAGMKSGSFLNEKTVKKLVIVMLLLSGAALVITNFS